METYSEFQPTGFDPSGIGLEDQQDWLVVPVARNRDSDCLAESNFACALKDLGGEGEDVQVHRFGHWANGWFEIIIVRPGSDAEKKAEEIESALADYPVLDDDDFYNREQEEAERIWGDNYSVAERISYIRDNRDQFEFRDMADLMGCVRGKYFGGDTTSFLN